MHDLQNTFKGEKYFFKNYRPINLTNTDNEIIAFIFESRLQKLMDEYKIN